MAKVEFSLGDYVVACGRLAVIAIETPNGILSLPAHKLSILKINNNKPLSQLGGRLNVLVVSALAPDLVSLSSILTTAANGNKKELK